MSSVSPLRWSTSSPSGEGPPVTDCSWSFRGRGHVSFALSSSGLSVVVPSGAALPHAEFNFGEGGYYTTNAHAPQGDRVARRDLQAPATAQ